MFLVKQINYPVATHAANQYRNKHKTIRRPITKPSFIKKNIKIQKPYHPCCLPLLQGPDIS